MKLLLTGGAGYIGSHTTVELLNLGHEVVIVDNLSNSTQESLKRVEEITGGKPIFYEADIRSFSDLESIFENEKIEGVIHFAGLKAVGESNEIPLDYYDNNVAGTINLLNVMKKHNVKNIIFSSSATVYGQPEIVPIPETHGLSTTNPYGETKLMVENILKDLAKSDESWSIIILRYFNPVGAHKSGKIGEDPKGLPNNLIPYITQVAVGKLKCISVFGDDYNTPDGTGVRDYIHVIDLALGHIASLKKFNQPGCYIYNLGTGNGYSVLEMIKAFSDTVGYEIPYEIKNRRAGDIATCYGNAEKAKKELGWEAKQGLKEMCEDSWRWQSENKNGY